jgi:hypothetical protein
MDRNKLQPQTARAAIRPQRGWRGILWENYVVEAELGDGRVVEIARMNDELTAEHQRRVAEAMAAAVRGM